MTPAIPIATGYIHKLFTPVQSSTTCQKAQLDARFGCSHLWNDLFFPLFLETWAGILKSLNTGSGQSHTTCWKSQLVNQHWIQTKEMGFFQTRKSNLKVLKEEQLQEPLRPSSQRNCYEREHKKLCRENTNTQVGLTRTEHETEHHKKKVPSVFAYPKYHTVFLRAHTPYRREGNKGALPASENSLFPV